MYIEGSHNIILKKLKIDFALANSVPPDIFGISSGSSLFAKVPAYGF